MPAQYQRNSVRKETLPPTALKRVIPYSEPPLAYFALYKLESGRHRLLFCPIAFWHSFARPQLISARGQNHLSKELPLLLPHARLMSLRSDCSSYLLLIVSTLLANI